MNQLKLDFINCRKQTVKLIENLHPEDTVPQPEVYVSPPKWHLAHTTWFFENFILKIHIPDYSTFHPIYDYLFNSYYQSQGERAQRDMRGAHPRPLLSEVLAYRMHVDEHISRLMDEMDTKELAELITLGINHEQQHQELLLMDLKVIWSQSPLYPALVPTKSTIQKSAPMQWLKVEEGLYDIGFAGEGFCFDNEKPQHKFYLQAFEIASRPVTNSEFLEFIEAGGYRKWNYWLDEGWAWVQQQGHTAPKYWQKVDGKWHIYTLSGLRKLEADELVCHVSFYEAEAYARWKGMRLPTEQEWEVAAQQFAKGNEIPNFQVAGNYHPTAVGKDTAFMGQLWEWTNSAYLPYPKFKPWGGAIGEYNGKFMINQMVLRGGSCVTPQNHSRITYRNFFHPDMQWPFTGIRLAKDL